MKTFLILIIIGFCLFCGVLVVESGIFANSTFQRGCILLQQTVSETDSTTSTLEQAPVLESAAPGGFHAVDAQPKTVKIGAKEPETENADAGFKFQLELTSQGAAIRKATFSNGQDALGRPTGFDDRDPDNPSPLAILSPAGDALSMVNKEFVFVDEGLQLRLNTLYWESYDVEVGEDGSQSARFEAVINKKSTNEPVVKLTKTYTVKPGSYDIGFVLTVENLTAVEKNTRFNMTGPIGIRREAARMDARKTVAAFKGPEEKIDSMLLDMKKLQKAKVIDDRRLQKNGFPFLWAGITNKYFAAILVPQGENTGPAKNWVSDKTGRFYNPDRDADSKSGDETIGLDFSIATAHLAPAGQAGSSKEYKFLLYLGPKDKSLFDKNDLYKQLGFIHAIDFRTCCCPASIIGPLAFGILALMKWMYGFIGNYGVVIMILVFLIRIILHPLTKKSQVSMSKFSKLAPKMEEIKKKYENNKAEMNKQLMALYREQGASPITGMLPMFVQMPIWISLYSAIYTSIDLRGAAFLPVWITDLSAPDALMQLPSLNIPIIGGLIGNSLNLLPLLMGIAFYLQQKLMPQQPSTNPQAAQQQKIMKIMLPLMFPLMLYQAPSGLNLYIMSSVSAGAIEQYIIRKHIREKEEAEEKGLVPVTKKTGGKVKKKKPKPFFKTH
ncbi:MAG: YidC/Oxa1 family insertase periplasmic-domain containing protein [Planctomycetota bacterium]|jgi:YidC/Oxa1 family membrane protein insertase